MNLNIFNILSKSTVLCGAVLFVFFCIACLPVQKKKTSGEIEVWLTKGDESIKLQKQKNEEFSVNKILDNPTIEINDQEKFQTVDGFGYSLTGGSVAVINRLQTLKRKALLQELFGNSGNSISISYLRISIGASDLNDHAFSYDDLPEGQTDVQLQKFSLEKDRAVIEMLKEILKINPKIRIIAAPWSAPAWMKDNGKTKGGSLKPEYFEVYANYFVKYIQEMKKNGISITAITPQNEPLHPGNNPSMYMTAESQRDFIKNNLGPAFSKNGIKTKIIVYDHNCNKPEYPLTILKDTEAAKYVDGSAFHLYEGEISALSTVHNAFPDKNLYFTEQWTGAKEAFSGTLNWHVKNVIIGSMRNWSRIALEWNLANDAEYKPFTEGGCTQCQGAITVLDNHNFTRNVAYYIIAHASKFVPVNSQRIASTQTNVLSTAAFTTPHGKKVLIVQNDSDKRENFNIKYGNKTASVSLDAKSVATYVFK